jgi:hypothetical protein
MKGRNRGDIYDFQLTDRELEILTDQKVPSSIRAVIRRDGSDVGAVTRAYWRGAARLRAERAFLEEGEGLLDAQNRLAKRETEKQQIAALERENTKLSKEVVSLREERNRLVAEPAAAVSAAGTR